MNENVQIYNYLFYLSRLFDLRIKRIPVAFILWIKINKALVGLNMQ